MILQLAVFVFCPFTSKSIRPVDAGIQDILPSVLTLGSHSTRNQRGNCGCQHFTFCSSQACSLLLSRSTLNNTDLPESLIPEPSLMKAFLKHFINDVDFETVLVYGIRGAGKAMAIKMALDNRLGFVTWTLSSRTGEAALLELAAKWKVISRPWPSAALEPTNHTTLVSVCETTLDRHCGNLFRSSTTSLFR
jgi:hypothetical protein